VVVLRLLFGLLLVAGLACLGLAVTTGQARWRRLGVVIVRWTVVAGLAAVGLLVVERLAVIL
jgi:hypothetical protein